MGQQTNMPNHATPTIEMRLTWLWPAFFRLSHILKHVGIRFSPRVVAWVAGHSVQARINSRWVRIVTPANEVIACVLGR